MGKHYIINEWPLIAENTKYLVSKKFNNLINNQKTDPNYSWFSLSFDSDDLLEMSWDVEVEDNKETSNVFLSPECISECGGFFPEIGKAWSKSLFGSFGYM